METTPAPTSDPYAPWRIPNFRRYAFSWFLMMFSKHVEFAAISFHFVKLYSSEQAALAIGLIGTVQAIPVILLAIPGGHFADRFNRQRVLLSTIAVTFTASIGMLGVIALEAPVFWIYACLAVCAIGRALGSPARASLLPQLVPAKLFSSALTWNTTAFYIATVTGPIVGGVLVGIADSYPSFAEYLWPSVNGIIEILCKNALSAFVLVAICRLVAMLAVFMIKHDAPVHEDQEMSWANVIAGVRFVWRTKLILATITLDMFAVLLGGFVFLLPLYAEKILHVGPWGFGFLRAAEAIGAMCMAVWIAHHSPLKRAGITLIWAIAGFGAWIVVFGISTNFWLSLVAILIIGAFDNISVVVRHTLVQMLTPDEMRGRVSAINGIFIVASNDLGGQESGLMAWLFTPVISVVTGGIGTIFAVVGAVALWPQILKIGSLDSIEPASLQEPDRETEA